MRVHSRGLFFSFFILCFLFFLSCKKTKEVEKQQVVSEAKEGISNNENNVNEELSKNEKIIQKLKEMKIAFENKSSQEMLQFFNFPTKNFMFIRRSEEFRKDISKNNDMVTKEHFLKYAKIRERPNHPSLYQLLSTLNLDFLEESNSIEKDLEIEGDECYYMYKIEIKDDVLIISYGANSNQKYSNEGDCSESHTFLYFNIVNDKIIFKQSDMAG
ncbi:hypothetical protein [Aquimarina sp. I32.4]|uniref:hypothetical protein n=1 Tax=Aquimarina sp. I32.4 TaxID=2053903 RepID=UPI0011AF92F6|nr:hypothetical protein [Aquimarina sp. I32.4]